MSTVKVKFKDGSSRLLIIKHTMADSEVVGKRLRETEFPTIAGVEPGAAFGSKLSQPSPKKS